MKLRYLATLTLLFSSLAVSALESVPKTEYRTRRVALAEKMKSGIAVLFAAEEPVLDFMPYRQDEDFYYLTGWNEPGAALIVVSATEAAAGTPGTGLGERAAQPYREILFLPTRNLRTEKYTGAKMDAQTAGVSASTAVDEVRPMSEMPAVLNSLSPPTASNFATSGRKKAKPPAPPLRSSPSPPPHSESQRRPTPETWPR